MTILDLTCPWKSPVEGVGQRISPSVGVENICWCVLAVSRMGCLCIVLLGGAQFVFFLPKGESKAAGGHPWSPSGFWEHSQVPLGSEVLLCPWASMTPEQGSSQVPRSSGCGCSAFGRSTRCKGKKLFPDCTNFPKQWELQQSQLPTCPISCASCGLPALLWGRKQWLGSKETWILSPPWRSSALGPALVCAPPGGGPSPAFTEIKATLLGEISDLLQVFFQGTNQFVKCSF